MDKKNKNKLFDNSNMEQKILLPKKTIVFDPLKVVSLKFLVTKKQFDEPVWFVKPFLPEGLTILAGKAKIGKSFFALNLAISISMGRKFLKNFQCTKTTVYYLPLEDNLRRIQSRARRMASDVLLPKNLLIPSQIHLFPKLNQGGLECLKNIINERPDIGVIIIDTYGRFIDKKNSNIQSFHQDYDILSELQTFAVEKHISILLIHHTTKSSGEDPFDDMQGTMGTQASPDNLIIIRKARSGISLYTKGRDVEERQYALKFDKTKLKWYLDGKPQEVGLSASAQEILNIMKKEPTKIYTLQEITGLTRQSKENTCNKLRRLVKNGFLEKKTENEYCLDKDTYNELIDEEDGYESEPLS